MFAVLVPLVLLAPPEPVQTARPGPVTRERDLGSLHITTTHLLSWRPVMTRNFGFEVVLQPVWILEIESRLPALRRFVFQIESHPANTAGAIGTAHARLQFKVPGTRARIGLEQPILGLFTTAAAGLLGSAAAMRVPGRAVFSLKF